MSVSRCNATQGEYDGPSLAFDAPSRGNAATRGFRAQGVCASRAWRRAGTSQKPLFVGRSVYARADERREVLCPAVCDRCADGRWGGRRSGREPRSQLRGWRSCAAHGGVARRSRGRGQGAQQIARPRRRATAISRQSRADRGDGLLRIARRGAGQGRGHRIRLGRGGRGRIGGGPDRQGQGHDRDRIGGGHGEMQVRDLAWRRRGDRL